MGRAQGIGAKAVAGSRDGVAVAAEPRINDPDVPHGHIKRRMEAHLAGRQPPQAQFSLAEQLSDLHLIATKLGYYDAADWLWKTGRLEYDR